MKPSFACGKIADPFALMPSISENNDCYQRIKGVEGMKLIFCSIKTLKEKDESPSSKVCEKIAATVEFT